MYLVTDREPGIFDMWPSFINSVLRMGWGGAGVQGEHWSGSQ